MPGVNTRDNHSYLEIEFKYNYGNFYTIKKTNYELLKINKLDDYSISLLAINIHNIIDNVRERLVELSCYDDFQMIIRIDRYLNLLPIDFRTAKSWINLNK